ncbi:hypothetical protein [Lysinibacillus sp. TE18511]
MTLKQRKPAGFLANLIAIIVILIFIAVSFVALPLLALLIGMGFGYVLELFTGDYVVQAFHSVGLTKVGSNDLPKVFGLLALIAIFFRNVGAAKNKRKGDD